MTPDVRAAIAQRAEKATKGPWTWTPMELERKRDGTEVPVSAANVPEAFTFDTDQGFMGLEDANAAFIAHAREDIPALLSALDATERTASQALVEATRTANDLRQHRDELLTRVEDMQAQLAEAEATGQARAWQPIETAPKDAELDWWVVPKSEDETYADTSGRPITSGAPPRLHRGKFKTWSALEKATHWRPLPAPPAEARRGPEQESADGR